MKKFFPLVVALFASGCASITQGTTQVISFSIDPPEAKCAISNNQNSQIGSVSGKSNLLHVSKGSGDLIANCTASGFEPKITRIVSTTQTAGVIGVAIDFGITDMLTGAMWKYPDHVTVVLEQQVKK